MPEVVRGRSRLHYETGGPETGPWIVLSGSAATDLAMWDALVSRIGGSFRILRVDQRGHGRSALGDEALGFSLLADDLAGLLDELGIREATIVGASMGGATALVLAAARPDLVSGVVVAGSRPASTPASETYWAEQLAVLERHGMSEIARRAVERWFTPRSVASESEAVRATRAMIERTPADGFAAAARLLGSYDIRDALRRVRCPVLLAYGDADPVPESVVAEMSELLEQVRVVTIADAGHLPAVEQPDRFAHIVEQFCQGREIA